MKKLKILRCGDVLNWAYHYVAQEHALFSKHEIEYATASNIDLTKNYDIIHIHGTNITPSWHANELPKIAHDKGIKVIGQYSGNPTYFAKGHATVYSYADLIITISPQTYDFAKMNYADVPIIYMPESINVDFFPYRRPRYEEFVIGWAGGAHKPVKRVWILDKLNFKVVKKDNLLSQIYSLKCIDLSKMKEFYNSIDCLLITSISECQPRPVMEAMASGVIVVSTNVGSVPLLIDKEWIVPTLPEEETIKWFNEKLSILKKYPSIRTEISLRNRMWIRKYWDWKTNAKLWDDVYEATMENNSNKSIQISEDFLKSINVSFPLKDPTIPNPLELEKELINDFNKKIEIIKKLNIPFWLTKKSCLYAMNNLPQKLPTLYIGVRNEHHKNLISQDILEGIDITINTNQKIKQCDNGFNVPYPVVPYLANMFGSNWKDLTS